MSARPLKQLPLRLHHQAFAVEDQERTRQFMEDVLGIPLVATWCERAHVAEVGRELEYCHAFYGLADGGAIAFFQFADPAHYELFKAQHPKQARFGHIALKVDRPTFEDIQRRLKSHGTPTGSPITAIASRCT